MKLFLIILAVVAASVLVQYTLYINGYLVVKAIRALIFRGSVRRWKTRPAARVVACTGSVRKILKFKESRTYQFVFTAEISKGSITAEIQNRHKETILKLDETSPRGVIAVQSGERYYLVVRFKQATGRFELTWL